MAATQTVPQYFRNCNFAPIVPRHGVITLFGYGIKVNVERGHLTIQDGIGADRREARLPRVGHGLRRLVLVGSDGMVSLAALRWLSDQDAAFVMLDRNGRILATTGPVSPSDVRMRRAQSLAHQSGLALQIAKELIAKKLSSQERLVRRQFGNEDTADVIAKTRSALNGANSCYEVRRFEAQGALAYWRAWHSLEIRYPASDLRRVPDHWQKFGSRMSPLTNSPRLASNPPNAILNFVYALLESESRLALAALGLDPGLGVLHNDTRNRDSLACDLMEPVRPQVDAFLLDWLRRENMRREWFFEERNGNCRLMGSFAALLSQTAQMWRDAVAPFAELILKALWSTRFKHTQRQGPATPLTQAKRRIMNNSYIYQNDKTKSTNHKLVVDPHEFVKAQDTTARTEIGSTRAIHKDPIAQRRRSLSQSRQAALRKVWNASEQPEWLDKEFYSEQIQTRLQPIQVSTIQAALSVSRPYALRIRAGQCTPHPRHWLVLAKLVNNNRSEQPEL